MTCVEFELSALWKRNSQHELICGEVYRKSKSTQQHLQSFRRSVPSGCVINIVHVKAKCLPGFCIDRTQIRAGRFTVLMERVTRLRSGAFLTVCQDAQCNHLIFLVRPHFAGVIFGCLVSLSASTKCVWDCAAQLNRLWNPCQLLPFPLTQTLLQIYPRNCFHLCPIDCSGAQVDSVAR